MKKSFMLLGLQLGLALCTTAISQTVVWGNFNSRTETRNDAGLQGNAGALSGFFETQNPVNFPAGASSWWHLLDVRHSNPGNNFAMQFSGSFYDQHLYFRKTNSSPTQGWSRVLLEQNGLVGVGTTAPQAKLHVETNTYAEGVFVRHQPNGIWARLMGGSTGLGAYNGMVQAEDAALIFGKTQPGNGTGFVIAPWSNTTGGLRVGANGNVSIGQVSTPAGYRLYVETGILTEKVKVAVKTGADWADHVFAENYKLMPLEQVAQFIQRNKHLPGIPSAADMVKEGNNLGQTDARLLEKIEELTLHVIDLNRRLQAQQLLIEQLTGSQAAKAATPQQ